MKVKNGPIVLSGRVFLAGILGDDLPHFALPAKYLVGDIKVHNVNKNGERKRYGQTIRYSGFMVANVFDGKGFRRLLLRKRAAVESTYLGTVERRERSGNIVRFLRTLIRLESVWFVNDSGYEVTSKMVAQDPQSVSKPTAENPVAARKTEAQPVTVAPAAAAKTEPVAPAKTAPTTHGRTVAKMTVRRRRRAKKVDENQLTLFTDLK
jgi:hypothetical protein